MNFTETSPKVTILMPLRDKMEPETAYALEHNVSFPYELLTEVGLPVDEARNNLARRALETDATIFIWIDSDAFWLPQNLERLVASAQAVKGAAFAVYSQRRILSTICAWYPWNKGVELERVGEDNLIQCLFIGTHLFAIKRDVLEHLGPDPWSLAPDDTSEDWAFARRLRAAGFREYLDTMAIAFHVEQGVMFMPGLLAYRLERDGDITEIPINHKSPMTPTVRSYGPTVDRARAAVHGAPRFSSAAPTIDRLLKENFQHSSEVALRDALCREYFRAPTDQELDEQVRIIMGRPCNQLQPA